MQKYSFSQRQLFTLLAAKNHENMSAVHIAIHHNHYKTVETYYAAINAISQSLSFSADELKRIYNQLFMIFVYRYIILFFHKTQKQ